MDIVCKYNKCDGCMACVDICPKGAITIKDDLQAYNAVIDNEKCVDCNACHNVCQRNHPAHAVQPIKWYQGWTVNNDVRSAASSGGVASALEIKFIEKGGIVCSCSFKNGKFGFEFTERVEDIVNFQGSKYVKSNPSGIYQSVKKLLESGRKVLFVGLPCQVSALKNYISTKLVDNLYTVDLICHGTPSPKILENFLLQYGQSLINLESIDFRRKANFQIKGDSNTIIAEGVCDRYSIAFLNSLIYTDNCYSCSYAKEERVSDITLGDSWGSDLPIEVQKQGVSLILCQTKKGEELLEDCNLVLKDVDIQKAIENNHQLKEPSQAPVKREYFFKRIATGAKFNYLVFKSLPKDCSKQLLKSILIRLRLWHRLRGGQTIVYQISIIDKR